MPFSGWGRRELWWSSPVRALTILSSGAWQVEDEREGRRAAAAWLESPPQAPALAGYQNASRALIE